MSAGRLTNLGPITVDFHGDPTFRFASSPDAFGIRRATIGGLVEWPLAHELSELVSNPHRNMTVGDHAGVLEFVFAAGDKLRPFVGWYLFEDFNLDADHKASTTGLAAFTLSAAFLGDGSHREIIVARSARPKPTDFDLTARSIVVSPFRPEEPTGDRFVIRPGGSFATRAYDPSSPHDTDALVPADVRSIGLYTGVVTSSSDEVDELVLPSIEPGRLDDPPPWVNARGGDVRAYDRRAEREVYGPAHPWTIPSDVLITNGLLRFWLGPRELPPYLHVQALAGGEWREVGYLLLAAPDGDDVLLGARLERLTPDSGTVALQVAGEGEVLVTLHRGERMIRVRHGSRRRPTVRTSRVVRWSGVPPWTRLEVASQGPAKFGKGLKGDTDGAMWADPEATWADLGVGWSGLFQNPDLRLRWPRSIAGEWTLPLLWRTDEASATTEASGFFMLYDDDGNVAVSLSFDGATGRFLASAGAVSVQSSPKVFAAGDDVFLAVRVSSTAGLALSVKVGAGAIEHVSNATPVTDAGPFVDLFFGMGANGWGEVVDWGEGPWGSVTWPDGVLSNVMLFEDRLTDAEVAGLSVATNRLAGLPTPEGRLVWYASLDPRPILAASPLTDGRRYESTGSSTRRPDDYGLTKALAVLDAGAGGGPGLSVQQGGDGFEAGAYLATVAPFDDLLDYHEQFAAESEQEVRIR